MRILSLYQNTRVQKVKHVKTRYENMLRICGMFSIVIWCLKFKETWEFCAKSCHCIIYLTTPTSSLAFGSQAFPPCRGAWTPMIACPKWKIAANDTNVTKCPEPEDSSILETTHKCSMTPTGKPPEIRPLTKTTGIHMAMNSPICFGGSIQCIETKERFKSQK